MLEKLPLIFLMLMSLCGISCVRQKLYRAELAARATAEGREKVSQQELTNRRKETADLTTQVASFNRTIGELQLQLKQTTGDLTTCRLQMSESQSKLAAEKTSLSKDLTLAKEELARAAAKMKLLQTRKKALSDLQTSLAAVFKEQEAAGVTVAIDNEAVVLTLPDKILFDNKGLDINVLSKPIFASLSTLLTSRPEVQAEIIAYTDNVLPKDKTLKDTWDWSLYRATNVVRRLIQEYNVNANQLTPVGRGEFYPLASNETAEGRQKNRRTTVVLHPALPALPTPE